MIEAVYILTGTFFLAVLWMARLLVSYKPVPVYIRKSRIGDRHDNR
jgi:hypothetical protein